MPQIKRTQDILYGHWTTVQLAGTGQLTDAAPQDDLGGPGPYLVMDRGIWKYPKQATTGRIAIPRDLGRPLRLTNVFADFGAATAWTLHVAGYDGTAQRPDDVSGNVYDAADVLLYREGDIEIAAGNNQYLSLNLDPIGAGGGPVALIHPGMHVYMTTVGAIAPLVRLTFNIAVGTGG